MGIILSIISILIVCGAAGIALLGTGYVVDKSLEDPDVLLNVFVVGNDLVVTIYEGRRVNEIVQLSIEIEGAPLSSAMSVKPAPKSGTGDVRFVGVCDGITGMRGIAIHGIFSDGRNQILKMNTIKFT